MSASPVVPSTTPAAAPQRRDPITSRSTWSPSFDVRVHRGAEPIDRAIDELVDDARGRIAAPGVEACAVYGNPVQELALYSASLDLLIVGSRDYGPIGRLVHGSTSHQLARSNRCPPARAHPRQRRPQATIERIPPDQESVRMPTVSHDFCPTQPRSQRKAGERRR